ncbi:glucan endo-1,3-beta-glucosidase [Tanacetum coccineum]|uniref:Glucan endo-1,3-beta-glucosidase n=1 Tax=Tanacetum coccineum TaxID=301880 RepID=A0ABQ5GB07_9ASTR
MSLTLFTLLFIFTATITATTTSHEKLIPTLNSKNITSVHLFSPTPETISFFSNTNISLLLTIPNSLIPSFSKNSNSSATSAWLLSHVTPFVPDVRISSISLGNNVTDANLLKLLLSGIDNVKEKVKGLGIKGVKVSTTVSLAFVNSKDIVAKELLGGLSEKDATLFVNVKHWNVSLGPFKEVVCCGFALKRDLSADVGYVSLDNNGEMMDYRVVEVRVLKVEEDKVKKDDDVDAILFLLILYYWNGKLLKLILHYGSVDPLGRLRSTCSGGVVPHQSACSFRHNVDEIKAMVQKQIEEVKVRQLAILNLAVEYDNACTAKDLRNAYEKYTDRKKVF